MSSELQFIFNNEKVIVLLDSNNTPWFKAKQIAEILGYARPKKAVSTHIRNKYKKILPNIKGCVSHPLHPQTIFINEPGIYSLIMRSKLPSAEKFQDWIFEEVLPSIRKQGEYKLVLKINQLTYKTQMLEDENKYMHAKICEMQPKLAVMPNNNNVKHIFAVYIKPYWQSCIEYKCLRVENRNFRKAELKLLKADYVLVYIKYDVPNAINILNRAKEIMQTQRMEYRVNKNSVFTRHNFINIIKQILEN